MFYCVEGKMSTPKTKQKCYLFKKRLTSNTDAKKNYYVLTEVTIYYVVYNTGHVLTLIVT